MSSAFNDPVGSDTTGPVYTGRSRLESLDLTRHPSSAPEPADESASWSNTLPPPNRTHSHPLINLIGPSLHSRRGAIPTRSIVGSGRYVGLYFAAQQYPPCRKFTRRLTEFYLRFKASHVLSDCFEIVLVSSDKSEQACHEAFQGMPWSMLPYRDRTRKFTLATMFKVQSLPALVIVDADTGELVTAAGYEGVLKDQRAVRFPWTPLTLPALLHGPLHRPERTSSFADACKGKICAVYFTARWCAACRAFTPQLLNFYHCMKGSIDEFEIVIASWDSDKAVYARHIASLPWWAYPRKHENVRALAERLGINRIPTLALFRPDGQLITTAGADRLRSDPTGSDFPYEAKPVERLTFDAIQRLHSGPQMCCIYFAASLTARALAHAEDLLMASALPEWLQGGGQEVFFYAADVREVLAQRLLALLRIQAQSAPFVVMVHLPEFTVGPDPADAAELAEFVNGFRKRTVTIQRVP